MNKSVWHESKNKGGCTPLECREMTEHLRQKAEKELFETKEKQEKAIHQLRTMILESREEWTINTEDSALIMFLRARKYDVNHTLQLIKNYYKWNLRYPGNFKNLCVANVEQAMAEKLITFLPYRAKDGSAIFFARLGKWNIQTVSFEQLVQITLLSLKVALQAPATQICGCRIIFDFDGLGWNNLFSFTPGVIRCFFTGLQECQPLRLKGMHVINNYAIFEVMFAIVKPFLAKKTKERLIFYGSKVEGLYDVFPPEILPEMYGGHLNMTESYSIYETVRENEKKLMREILDYGFWRRKY